MHKGITTLAITTAGILIGCLSTSARAQYASILSPRCPAGYWLLEPVCINQDSGDVVNATPAPTARLSFAPGCAPGYWRLESLCVSPATGDVELVDEKTWPAEQYAELRN